MPRDQQYSPLAIIVVLFTLVSISVGGFYLKRYWNYKFGYEARVREEVKAMVKLECLK